MMPDALNQSMWIDPAFNDPLDDFIRCLHAAHGLDISSYDESFLRKSITRKAVDTGFKSLATYGTHLTENRAAATNFYHSLQVCHSSFFRNSLTFALLEQRILPNLIAQKKQAGHGEIRIWSTACAAGQEAWSVAMLLDELTRNDAAPVPYRIFASDISERELNVGRMGVYSAEAMANVRLRHLNDCCSHENAPFVIAPRLRERVEFAAYDLLDPNTSSPETSIYGDFDLIFCSNLLFYYRHDIQQKILSKLCHALTPGGYFVTGETERHIVAAHEALRALAPASAVFQKKYPMV